MSGRGWGTGIGDHVQIGRCLTDDQPVDWVSIACSFAPRTGGFTAYGQQTANGMPQAVMTNLTACQDCGGRVKEGEHWTADLAIPPAEGRWHHTDCDDPKLEKVAD